MKDKQRVRRYKVCPEIMCFSYTTGTKWLVKDGLPEDSKFVGVTHHHADNSFYLFVEHESFDEIEIGQEAPLHDIVCERIQ